MALKRMRRVVIEGRARLGLFSTTLGGDAVDAEPVRFGLYRRECSRVWLIMALRGWTGLDFLLGPEWATLRQQVSLRMHAAPRVRPFPSSFRLLQLTIVCTNCC